MDRAQPQPPNRLSELPSWLAGQLALTGQRLVADALDKDGMRRNHFAVLTALAQDGATSQAELGRRLSIDRSDLHAVLNDLEGDGLVRRLRDAEDRRRNAVALTAAGARTLRRLDARVQGAQEELLEPLSPAQRAQLVRLLSKLAAYHGHDESHRPKSGA
jgi:MarR family transcriptional regulator, lower aerobic nicotinate degradation pathway regulator